MRAILRFFESAWLLWPVVPLLIAALVALDWLADLFWFQALGYAAVFWRLLLCQLGLFAAASCVMFIYTWGNLRLLGHHVDLLGTAAARTSSRTALLRGPNPSVPPGLIRIFEVLRAD